jgi:hypothetical protein
MSFTPSPRYRASAGAFFSSGGFNTAPHSFCFALALPVKAGLVSDAPASTVHVIAGAFALLPERIESHATDALCDAELIDRIAWFVRGKYVSSSHLIRSVFVGHVRT